MKKNKQKSARLEKTLLFYSESGTATVIGAVMLLGIIFSVLTIAWVDCVPEWKNDAEYSHMDDVWKDMAELKSRVDVMSIVLASSSNCTPINSLYSNCTASDLVTSVSFHMGGSDIPFIASMKSSGTLAVNKGKCVMSIIINPDTTPKVKSVDCGTVTYTSQNGHYVDQVFSYENGALILDQEDQSVMMLYPSIRFSTIPTNGHNEYNILINAVSFHQNPKDLPEIISSNSECSLRLTGINYISLYDSEKDNLDDKKNEPVSVDKFIMIITSNYPEAWIHYLNKAMADAKISSEKYKIERLTGNNVRFTFTVAPATSKEKGSGGSNANPDIIKRMYISETVIKAEPGIGLV
ncbi:hypothetical protein [Methanosarcina sp. UBA289]|uniref:hypothetical protein n=1 Tax=Methanosarcina sp. UBA289 TaxID=1915574 RepID=UPI0025CCE44D|nr:hypothetical protein [Methanosarcina sp. UBA289]